MSKKSIIKRALALGFCLLLAIIALLFPMNKTVVRAGAGNGTSKKIQTTAELSALLEQIASQMERGTEPLSLLSASESSEYESVTLEDTLRYNVRVNLGQAYSKARLDRTMTAYLTKDVTYYISEMTMSGDYQMPEQTAEGKVVQEAVHRKTDISVRIHIYKNQDVSMILFERYTYILNGVSHALPSAALGKWIVFSAKDDYAIYNSIASVDRHNFAALSLIGEMLEDESLFKHSGSTYTMTDEAFLGFLAGLEKIDGVSRTTSEEDKGKGSLVANFGNPRRPGVTLAFKDSYSDPDSGGYGNNSSAYSMSIAETEELIFTNIDNTVIGEPSERGTLTIEELNEFFKDWEE